MSTTTESRDLSYAYEESGRTPVITLKAEMAQQPLAQVEEAGNAIIERIRSLNPANLVVDLTELEYMGSAMVALIVRLWKQIKDKKGHKMVVAVRADGVLEVLELARLTEYWTITETRTEARKVLGLKAPKSGTPGSGPQQGNSVAEPSGQESPVLFVAAVVSGVVAVCGSVVVARALLAPAVGVGITAVAALAGLVTGTLLVLSDGPSRKVVGGIGIALSALAIILALALYPAVPAG